MCREIEELKSIIISDDVIIYKREELRKEYYCRIPDVNIS